ncbi:MAG: ATP-binding protein [Nitrospirota bacterium]
MTRRISLQSLITLSVLTIGLLSGTIGLAYAYWQAKLSLQASIGLTFQELARQSADKVGLILAKEIEWVERLSALPDVQSAARQGSRLVLDRPAFHEWREEQRQYFRSLVVIDRQGRSVGGVTSDAARTYYQRQPWWPVVFEQRRPWAGDLRVDESGRGFWEIAAPIIDEDGAALGALKVVIGKDELFASVLRSRIGETGHVMLVGERGEVLACPVLPPAWHRKAAGIQALRDRSGRVRRGAAWLEVESDTHGSRGSIVGIAPVSLPSEIAPDGIWYILVRQDPRETYAPLVALTWKLAAFWVGAVGLVALFRWRLARRIVKPINALVDHVRSIGQGPLPKPLATPPSGIVEIDTLAASFADLTERLERASQESQRYVRELEKANREMATSEAHYRMLWNHSVDAKLLVDAARIVQGANRRAEMKLGRRAEELVGMQAEHLFVEADRAVFLEAIRKVLETGEENTAADLRVRTPDGAVLVMETDLVLVEPVGAGASVMLQLSDVTEKKQLERQLLRSERLASLSQFASMFAHDIRNPLAGIKKTLELLGQREELQAEPQRRWFQDLRFTTDLLLGMINDMLDVYQESYSGLPLITSRFSVNAALGEVVQLFRSEAEARDVIIRLRVPHEEVWMTADRRRFQRVAMNLIHNALKYSPPESRITVTLEAQPEVDLRAEGPGRAESAVLIRVEDEGPGIEPEDLPHLFEMFFRKKDGRDLRIGRGLGLHFCWLVAEAHHGRIWAANRAEGGAVFSILLPANQEAPCLSPL